MNANAESKIDTIQLKTVNGECVPDTVLRVENFHEKLALLNIVAMHSDEKSLEIAREMPFDYWNSIQSAVTPFYSCPVSSLDCKMEFYKLFDSYKYLITHLIHWPANCLQRLWPLFAQFHKIRDLSPFYEKILDMQCKYDRYPKSHQKWVTGGDFVTFQCPAMVSSLPLINPNSQMVPVIGYCDIRAPNDKPQFGGTSFKKPIEECKSPESLNQNFIVTNKHTICDSSLQSLDVKSIVKNIVSNLPIAKEPEREVSATQQPNYCTQALNSNGSITDNDSGYNEEKTKISVSNESDKYNFSQVNGEKGKEHLSLNSSEEQIVIECIKKNMQLNEFLLNFRKEMFWERVAEDVATKLNRFVFDVESLFKRYTRTYMDFILNKKYFRSEAEHMKLIWPLFHHIHDLDISCFLPLSEVDKYRRAKLELLQLNEK